MFRQFSFGWALVCLSSSVFAHPEAPEFDIDITQSSIEELLNVRVTTASRRSEPVSRSPAAVHVLTEEDILRSGATSIPDALRLVPGVQVASIDANKWAVSIRGFNSRTANKLLVLIDGRTIYDPLFTGVLWETKDVMLEDVSRIEVVRGPGGALWGSNAVNGVINIITKSARRTLGGLATASIGTEGRFANLRYGFELGEAAGLRLYARWVDRDSGFLPDGDPNDASEFGQAGFRFDGRSSDRDSLTIQGDIFDAEQGAPSSPVTPDSRTRGANLLGRWVRELGGGGTLTMQGFYDFTDYDFRVLDEKRDTVGLELQHQLPRFAGHGLIWGFDYRVTEDEIVGTPQLTLDPTSRTDRIAGIYVQDEIELLADELFLTLGAKFETNDYTGSNVQPSVRVAWQIDSSNFLWASVSEAVRTPSRLEHDFVIPLGGGLVFRGDRTMHDEELRAIEVGYRAQPNDAILLDLALFANRYDDLATVENLALENGAHGDVLGLEATATYVQSEQWKIVAGYSYLDMDLELDAGSVDNTGIARVAGSDPANQAFARLSFTPGSRYALDAAVRYVDELPFQAVDSYLVADVRFVWNLSQSLRVSVAGRNLFASRHAEQGNSVAVSEVEDSLSVTLAYAF